MAHYVCPRCGVAGSVDRTRPSSDDRWALGTCAATPKCRGIKQLERDDVFNRRIDRMNRGGR